MGIALGPVEAIHIKPDHCLYGVLLGRLSLLLEYLSLRWSMSAWVGRKGFRIYMYVHNICICTEAGGGVVG